MKSKFINQVTIQDFISWGQNSWVLKWFGKVGVGRFHPLDGSLQHGRDHCGSFTSVRRQIKKLATTLSVA